ncbi:MAG: hypothetical protein IMZ43_12180, partial [Thermoplasmata archaeon]|nr:hypothetical protein [Thermoplasmata archaeon]
PLLFKGITRRDICPVLTQLRILFTGEKSKSNGTKREKEDTTPLGYDTEASINGHMPFGVTHYPKEKTPLTFWQ